MTYKSYGVIGIVTPIVFLTTYLIMSSIRPEYSMFTKAISELGSLDASNKWLWNSFGYILTGILIAIYAIGLYKNIAVTKSSKLPLYGILLSGVFMAISGIFPGDFNNRQSTTMLLHTLGSFGSYIFFLIGAFTYPKVMSKTEYWKNAKTPTLIFTYLTIVFGAWVFIFPNMPALGQRITFLFYFLWITYTAIRLYRQPKENPVANNVYI
ncbi:DUF998 domain-containing protein [Maribacter antarcticus]|uniref:DUF998 domain-containing protein n=1 Tax=Maribacter antarcticus TaxID=505250 RepID=UPI000A02A9F3|nr:DUF998 domain-containing protein [Maribacter antarcticus]